MTAFLGIKTRNDFYLEFKGEMELNTNSIVALDDISLHPIERCQRTYEEEKFIYFDLK